MSNFNKVILMGRLTRDPEVRVSPNNNTICKMGLAVSRNYTTSDGEKREETTFVDVDAFGRPAEVLGKYMSKGRPILLEGRLKLDQWENQQGEKRSKLGVVLENFQFVGGRDDASGGGGGGGYESSSPPKRSGGAAPAPDNAGNASGGGDDTLDEDVPF